MKQKQNKAGHSTGRAKNKGGYQPTASIKTKPPKGGSSIQAPAEADPATATKKSNKEPIKIVIPLNPVTKKNNSRIVKKRNGGGYMLLPSEAYCNYEYHCYPYLLKHKHKIDKPVNVECIYYRRSRHRVDLCNLHEAICDVLVKYEVVVDDNANIIATMDGSRVEYDPENPRTEITITFK